MHFRLPIRPNSYNDLLVTPFFVCLFARGPFVAAGVRAQNRPPGATDILAGALKRDTSLNFIDLITPLLAAKNATEGLIYHKTDHHWTDNRCTDRSTREYKKTQENFPQVEQWDTAHWHLCFEDTPGWSLAGIIGIQNDVVEHVPMYKPVNPTKAIDTASAHLPPENLKEDYIISKKTGSQECQILLLCGTRSDHRS